MLHSRVKPCLGIWEVNIELHTMRGDFSATIIMKLHIVTIPLLVQSKWIIEHS